MPAPRALPARRWSPRRDRRGGRRRGGGRGHGRRRASGAGDPAASHAPRTRHGRRDRVADVYSHAHRQPLQRLAVPAAFAQDPRELALPQQHVVRPFEAGHDAAQQGVYRIGDGEPDAHGHDAQLGARRAEQHAEPDAARRGMPRASVASPPRGLRFGEHHRPRGGALRGDVVNGLEGRAELAEQAALRHTPPPGEFGRRDAVERQRHATRPATSATIPTSIAPLRRRLVPWVRPVNNRLATASTTSWANRAMRKYAPW